MIGEFKKFIMRGNVIDMAVGIIIGGAFTKIVNSMVADIMMPPLGLRWLTLLCFVSMLTPSTITRFFL